MSFYSAIRPFVFMQDAESAHDKTLWLLQQFSKYQPALKLLNTLHCQSYPQLEVEYWGKKFKNPLGLAAGLDKDAKAFNAFFALGFGFVEVGTVTPLAQSGNPKPRLFRLTQDEALINRMGFNNSGVRALVKRLQNHQPLGVLGVNIGKNQVTPLESAVDDYVKAFCAVEHLADYVVINVSSPNTENLRQLQEASLLENLIDSVVSAKTKQQSNTAILLKISPDLSDNQLSDIASLVKSKAIDGIIATNTTCSREGLRTQKFCGETGGLSGTPLKERANEVLRTFYQALPPTMPIIGVGGIRTAQDAYERFLSGASMIQIYTSMIYQGPAIVQKIHQGLIQLLEQDGVRHISEMIGTTSLS